MERSLSPQDIWLLAVGSRPSKFCASRMDARMRAPAIWVPTGATSATKLAAVRTQQSQLTCLGYRAAFHGLSAYRSLLGPESRFVEAFINGDRLLINGY